MKNKTSGFIAYKKENDGIALYLQMRTEDAPHNPGMYGIFGGKREGNETREEALVREVKEELSVTITPEQCTFLGEFEENVSVVSLFCMEVPEGFESTVDVKEGQYGAFINEHDIPGNNLITEVHQHIFLEVIRHIKEGL